MRYNHRLVERKILKNWNQASLKTETAACAFLIPKDGVNLDLENARLLIFADFFGYLRKISRPKIYCPNAQASWLKQAQGLGLFASPNPSFADDCHLLVFSRDFFSKPQVDFQGERLNCGRLFAQMPLMDLLEDFGADALRIYFLHQGPIERDYHFNWEGLAAAHRFVQKIWRLALEAENNFSVEKESLAKLRANAAKRLQQKKPHTALAAVMEFLKNKEALTKGELAFVLRILRPYAPFLTEEIFTLYDISDLKLKWPEG